MDRCSFCLLMPIPMDRNADCWLRYCRFLSHTKGQECRLLAEILWSLVFSCQGSGMRTVGWDTVVSCLIPRDRNADYWLCSLVFSYQGTGMQTIGWDNVVVSLSYQWIGTLVFSYQWTGMQNIGWDTVIVSFIIPRDRNAEYWLRYCDCFLIQSGDGVALLHGKASDSKYKDLQEHSIQRPNFLFSWISQFPDNWSRTLHVS